MAHRDPPRDPNRDPSPRAAGGPSEPLRVPDALSVASDDDDLPGDTTIHWTEPLETVVKKKAEQCAALAWAHESAQRWCASWNSYLLFPSIVLSMFSGAGALGADKILPFEGSSTVIGVVSLVVTTLQAIQNQYKFASRSESHRIASLQYNKIYDHLATQLSLPRDERKPAGEIVAWIQNETERLSEIVPLIPASVKKDFQKRFHDLEKYAIPNILNGLEPVSVTTVDFSKLMAPASMPRPTESPSGARIRVLGAVGSRATGLSSGPSTTGGAHVQSHLGLHQPVPTNGGRVAI
jgi:hypothetical protein